MNNISVIGRITKDLELRYYNDKDCVCSFTLAVNRKVSKEEGKQTADFIPVKVFNKVAENLNKYCKKGSQIAITGRLESSTYEKDGKTLTSYSVNATQVEFLDSKTETKKDDREIYEAFGNETTESELPF